MQTGVHEPGGQEGEPVWVIRGQGATPWHFPSRSKLVLERWWPGSFSATQLAGMAGGVYLTCQLSYPGSGGVGSWRSVLSPGTGLANPVRRDFLGAKMREQVMR